MTPLGEVLPLLARADTERGAREVGAVLVDLVERMSARYAVVLDLEGVSVWVRGGPAPALEAPAYRKHPRNRARRELFLAKDGLVDYARTPSAQRATEIVLALLRAKDPYMRRRRQAEDELAALVSDGLTRTAEPTDPPLMTNYGIVPHRATSGPDLIAHDTRALLPGVHSTLYVAFRQTDGAYAPARSHYAAFSENSYATGLLEGATALDETHYHGHANRDFAFLLHGVRIVFDGLPYAPLRFVTIDGEMRVSNDGVIDAALARCRFLLAEAFLASYKIEAAFEGECRTWHVPRASTGGDLDDFAAHLKDGMELAIDVSLRSILRLPPAQARHASLVLDVQRAASMAVKIDFEGPVVVQRVGFYMLGEYCEPQPRSR